MYTHQKPSLHLENTPRHMPDFFVEQVTHNIRKYEIPYFLLRLKFFIIFFVYCVQV